MKINWFSPLPPAKTDIAEYTIRLLPALAKNCQLELWTDQTIYDRELNHYAKVNSYQIESLPWARINQADLNIYQIGNNPDFHQQIWQVSYHCPGLVVLHDVKLQHFFGGIYRDINKDKHGYLKQMRYYYGIPGEIAAEKFWDGKISTESMAERYPLTALALKNSLAVITHSQQAYTKLKQENLWLTGYIPLPYPSQVQLLNKKAKNNREYYQLIIFGYIGVNRCLEIVLESLAQFPQRECFRLDIYGEIWNASYIKQRINELDLNSLVTLHGFVPETELENALANSDLAINLRYPTMGEASGSQLRVWSHGLPSLVTKIGWYAELPDDTVAYVHIDHEIEDIHQHLQAFIKDPERYRTMGKKGQNWLEKNHSPESYVQAILAFAKEICPRRHHATANYFIERVGKEIGYWQNDYPSNLELKNLAEAIHFLTSS